MQYNITFQQISMFLEIAKRLNVTAVAEEMHISQTAMSRMIQRLEENLGVKLFERSNRGLSLTPQGEFLYSRLRRPYSSINNALSEIKNSGSAKQLTLKIGYPSTFDLNNDYDKLKEFIENYELRNPEYEYIESVFDFLELKHALADGEIDVAFLHSFILGDIEGIETRPVCNCRTFLAMSENHPLAANDSFTPEMLSGETMYSMQIFDKGFASDSVSKLLGSEIRPREVQYMPNFVTLLRALKNGKGVSLCGYFLDPAKNGIKFLPLPKDVVTHSLNVAWRSDNIQRAVTDFVSSFPGDPSLLTAFYDPSSQ